MWSVASYFLIRDWNPIPCVFNPLRTGGRWRTTPRSWRAMSARAKGAPNRSGAARLRGPATAPTRASLAAGNSPGCPSHRSRAGRTPPTCWRQAPAPARAGALVPGRLLPRPPWPRPAHWPRVPVPGALAPHQRTASPQRRVPARRVTEPRPRAASPSGPGDPTEAPRQAPAPRL